MFVYPAGLIGLWFLVTAHLRARAFAASRGQGELQRQRIAQDVHDGIGSQLVSIISSLDLKITVDSISQDSPSLLEGLGMLRYRIQPSLDRLGVDTSEVRSNDRKLLFAEAGIVTMRPSDVPTYVEHGSADIGITGKDVLLEQEQRDVYELLDLGFGPCRMVFATVDGENPAAEALRRLGVMRVATKYPKIAARYFERTGRQAEIVEVKGSVELAPLAGLVEGIVDLTATGTTLRENGLVIREEIAASTARLIANPVAHKLRAAEIDALVERIRAV